MNYNEVRSIMTQGINFMSDASGVFPCYTQVGTVSMVNGVEVSIPGVVKYIKGAIREIKSKDIDGEFIQFGDKRGFFTYEQEIKEGYRILVDGEMYIVIDPRPVKPTGTVVAYRPILRRIATYG